MVLLIDGNNLSYRARYAYNLSYRGHDVSVTYGTVRMIQGLIRKFKPKSVIMCWDGGIPGFRKRLVPEYKATRKKKEDPTYQDFVRQLKELEYIIPYFGILQVRRLGIEADDLLYHASRMLNEDSIIVTADEDLQQAVCDKVSVYKPGKKDRLIEFFIDALFYGKYYVEWKALQGDSSDNIKGINGVGPKTATKLMDGEAVSDRIKAKVKEYYSSGKFDAAYDCIDLSVDRAGARYTLLDAQYRQFDNVKVTRWCFRYGFLSLMETHSLGMIYGRLEEPEFSIDGLAIPRIWDFRRCPI